MLWDIYSCLRNKCLNTNLLKFLSGIEQHVSVFWAFFVKSKIALTECFPKSVLAPLSKGECLKMLQNLRNCSFKSYWWKNILQLDLVQAQFSKMVRVFCSRVFVRNTGTHASIEYSCSCYSSSPQLPPSHPSHPGIVPAQRLRWADWPTGCASRYLHTELP